MRPKMNDVNPFSVYRLTLMGTRVLICMMMTMSGCQMADNHGDGNGLKADSSQIDSILRDEQALVKIDSVFPFNRATEIELFSFLHFADPLRDGEIDDGLDNYRGVSRETFELKKWKYRKILDKKNYGELFAILNGNQCSEEGGMIIKLVYSANNAIIFRENGKAFTFLELDFDCGRVKFPEGHEFGSFCLAKVAELEQFFVKMGMEFYTNKRRKGRKSY